MNKVDVLLCWLAKRNALYLRLTDLSLTGFWKHQTIFYNQVIWRKSRKVEKGKFNSRTEACEVIMAY